MIQGGIDGPARIVRLLRDQLDEVAMAAALTGPNGAGERVREAAHSADDLLASLSARLEGHIMVSDTGFGGDADVDRRTLVK